MPKIYNPYFIGAVSVRFPGSQRSKFRSLVGVCSASVFTPHFAAETPRADISSLSAFLGTTQYVDYFNHPSDILQGGITASMSGGSFVGALCAGFLSDTFGRRHVVQVAAVIWIIGSSITSASQGVAMLIVGRYTIRLPD
jgi:MFS family permease